MYTYRATEKRTIIYESKARRAANTIAVLVLCVCHDSLCGVLQFVCVREWERESRACQHTNTMGNCFVFVTCLIRTCDMTRSCVCDMSHSCVSRDAFSFICVTWPTGLGRVVPPTPSQMVWYAWHDWVFNVSQCARVCVCVCVCVCMRVHSASDRYHHCGNYFVGVNDSSIHW